VKILVLYPYVPWPLDRGTHHRTYHLLEELAAKHEVSLVALAEKGEGAEHADLFRKFCRHVEVIPFVHPPWQRLFPQRLLNPLPPNVAHWTIPGVAARLNEILAQREFDAVHVCDIVMAQYFLRRKIPLIIDRSRVDLQYQLAEHRRMNFTVRQRLLRCEGYAKLWWLERRLAGRAALEIVCGPDDERFLRRWVKGDMAIEVVVNGVDTKYFAPDGMGGRAANPTLIFCGAMDYNPNIDALRWYFDEIHEAVRRVVPDVETLIVGKNPTPEILAHGKRPGVTVSGGVPDVRPYYRRAWAQIVPLRIGGGTRLKIVESLSIGTPVISTSIGAQGLDLEHDREILLADNAADFVAATARMLQEPDLRERLREGGMAAARHRFGWERIGSLLREIYEERVLFLGEAAAAEIGHGKNAAAIRPPRFGLDPFGAGRG